MPIPATNRLFRLASRPSGMPGDDTFELVESPIPVLNSGDILVEAHYLSVDPYMRGRISGARSYARPVEIGEVMTGAAVVRVLASTQILKSRKKVDAPRAHFFHRMRISGDLHVKNGAPPNAVQSMTWLLMRTLFSERGAR